MLIRDLVTGVVVSVARGRLGLNQLDFARCLGINQSAVSRLESGGLDIRYEHIVQFAHVFGYTVDEFVTKIETLVSELEAFDREWNLHLQLSAAFVREASKKLFGPGSEIERIAARRVALLQKRAEDELELDRLNELMRLLDPRVDKETLERLKSMEKKVQEFVPIPVATLAEAEREHILKVLGVARGNRSLAARWLGIERRTLLRKLKDYGIKQ